MRTAASGGEAAGSTAANILAGKYIGLEEVDDGIWAVYYGPTLLGRFQERTRAIIGTHNRNRFRKPRQ